MSMQTEQAALAKWAYDQDVAKRPTYDSGEPRAQFDQLSDLFQRTWASPDHPVYHADHSIDKRYTVALEYTGKSTPEYVARFCGERIGAHVDRYTAHKIAIDHAKGG